MSTNKKSLKVAPAKKGRPTKYRAKKHIRLLVEVFSKGGNIGDFCKLAGVGRSTFYTWCRIDPRFHDAFDILICHAECVWWKLPFLHSQQKINLRTWMCVMRNRFRWGLPKFRARDIREGSSVEMVEFAYHLFEEGEMSLIEYEKVVTREHGRFKAKMERDLEVIKAERGIETLGKAPDAQKDVALTQLPEEALTPACVDPDALFVLMKANIAEMGLPVR
jgi:hypothetical protein